jgi:hypothetical protein
VGMKNKLFNHMNIKYMDERKRNYIKKGMYEKKVEE